MLARLPRFRFSARAFSRQAPRHYACIRGDASFDCNKWLSRQSIMMAPPCASTASLQEYAFIVYYLSHAYATATRAAARDSATPRPHGKRFSPIGRCRRRQCRRGRSTSAREGRAWQMLLRRRLGHELKVRDADIGFLLRRARAILSRRIRSPDKHLRYRHFAATSSVIALGKRIITSIASRQRIYRRRALSR